MLSRDRRQLSHLECNVPRRDSLYIFRLVGRFPSPNAVGVRGTVKGLRSSCWDPVGGVRPIALSYRSRRERGHPGERGLLKIGFE